MARFSNISQEYLAEKDFLIKFAVDSYNKKYGRKLDYKLCQIKSVMKAYGYTYGYQVQTMRSDDNVIIMLYFSLGDITRDHIVRVETIQNVVVNLGLGDEVYVVTGEVARFYKDQCIYKFRWLKGDDFEFSTVMFMDNDMIQFMDGGFLAFMSDELAPPLAVAPVPVQPTPPTPPSPPPGPPPVFLS